MFKYLDLILGIMSIFYYGYLKVIYGGMAFSGFFIIIGFILIGHHYVKEKIKTHIKFNKIFNILISVMLVSFILGESLLILYPKTNIKDDCDYLMVLGASVKKTTPSLTLKGRLDIAIKYLKESNDDCYIVVSGGKGEDEHISEAEAMKLYLMKNGVLENQIITEDKSTSTYENFKYSKDKIEQHSLKSIENVDVKVVTTDFHSFRSSILAKRNGYNNVTFYTSDSLKQFIPVYYTREFFATIKTIIFDK